MFDPFWTCLFVIHIQTTASNKLEVETPEYFVDFCVDMNHFIGL